MSGGAFCGSHSLAANGINEAVNPDVGYVAIPKYVASATNPLPAFAARG